MSTYFCDDGFEFLEDNLDFGPNASEQPSPEPAKEARRESASPIFQFARRLIGEGNTNPKSCKSYVELFCKKHRLPFRESWVEFNLAWEKVKYPDYGVDGFEVAVEKAKKRPVSLLVTPLEPKEVYFRVASIAFYLSEHNRGHEFLLPVKKLMKVLKFKSTRIVSKIVKWLRENDVIRCVNEKYSFGGKHPFGKKYLLGSGITKTP